MLSFESIDLCGDKYSITLLTNILEAIIHFIPHFYGISLVFIILYILDRIFISFFIFLGVCSFIFSKSSQLPKLICTIISVFIAVFGHVGTTAASFLITFTLRRLIEYGYDS
jgi:hypothetical protein